MNMFTKIMIAPLVAVAMMVLMAGANMIAEKTQNAALSELRNTRQEHLEIANKVGTEMLEIQSRTYRVMIWMDQLGPQFVDKEAKKIREDSAGVIKRFTNWAAEPDLNEDEKKAAKVITDLLGVYSKDLYSGLDLVTVDLSVGLSAMTAAESDYKKLDVEVRKLVEIEKALSEQALQQSEAAGKRAFVFSVVFLLVAVSVSVFIGLYLARSISTRLAEASAVAGRVAEGDLSSNIAVSGNDEVSQLLSNMQRMQSSLREIVASIAKNAGDLRGAAGQLNMSSSDISHSVGEQAGSVQSTAAAVEQLTVSIDLVSQNAESARRVALRTTEIAEKGKDLVGNAASEFNKIAQTVRDTSVAMQSLQGSTKDIGSIANVIREIADQTNLLALNAAIEAARAGEQGRGFAVVADEVRKLAEKTTSATNEIKSVIDTIQKQSKDAGVQMEQVTHRVASGVGLIHALQEPLQELFEGANGALVALVDLATAAREQSNASTQIASNVERIAQSSERNSESAQKGHQTAGLVDRMASGLQDLVGRFRC